MKRVKRKRPWQSLYPATAAVALACLVGCKSPDTNELKSESVPDSPAEARQMMQRLDSELDAAGVDAGNARHIREQMRSRLVSADLPEDEINRWTGEAVR